MYFLVDFFRKASEEMSGIGKTKLPEVSRWPFQCQRTLSSRILKNGLKFLYTWPLYNIYLP
jgi:hypothetical protein